MVRAAIARIEAVNPTINAVITHLFEEALAEARRPLPTGPLAGVPFLLKDLGTGTKKKPPTLRINSIVKRPKPKCRVKGRSERTSYALML